MMKFFKEVLFLFILLSFGKAFTQNDSIDYYKKDYFRFENFTYKKNIKTVLLSEESWEFSPPIIELNGGKKLKFSFDDLDGDFKNYAYTVIQCDENWQPSQLRVDEYIGGFTEDYIRSYTYSVNTIQRYTHYSFTFPNENFIITKSGNYLLKVYLDDDKDNVVITRRFMIVEPLVAVVGLVKSATSIEYMNSKQEIDFTIKPGAYTINNPSVNLNITITQNDRWDNMISGLKPLFVRGTDLVYDYEKNNIFQAGNEFRNLDIRTLKTQSINVARITYDSLKNHIYLLCDAKRAGKTHTTVQDINGRFSITSLDIKNSEAEIDYAFIHFCLKNYVETQGSFYILGGLTDWKFTDEAKLKYNYKTGMYETSIYLKQGYYNYEYVLLKNKTNIADESYIEGSYYEAENQYCIYVYYREPGTLYDKLIAYKRINSQ